jgi:hypothetical protein
MTYATNEEIFAAIKPMTPPRSDEFIVIDAWAEAALADVNNELLMGGIAENSTDIANLLKLAQICYYMDIAKNGRQIEYVTGDVRGEMMGKYKKEYSNSMPMFFFAQGSSRPFFQLLPTETFRMRAYKYIEGYQRAWFFNKYERRFVSPVVQQDTTSRGYGWEDAVSDTTTWRCSNPWGDDL